MGRRDEAERRREARRAVRRQRREARRRWRKSARDAEYAQKKSYAEKRGAIGPRKAARLIAEMGLELSTLVEFRLIRPIKAGRLRGWFYEKDIRAFVDDPETVRAAFEKEQQEIREKIDELQGRLVEIDQALERIA